jgi:hypothetical protein
MKKITLLTLSVCLALGSTTFAQDKLMRTQKAGPIDEFKKLYFGFGLGLDYGGLGCKVEYLPIKYVGVFGGIGYNFAGIGLNAGASFKALPDCKITPTVIGMYGYNSVIVVSGASLYNKTYFGPTAGIGGELKLGRKNNKLYAAILYPFRNEKFDDDYEALKANPTVSITQDKSPVTFSIGFNFSI